MTCFYRSGRFAAPVFVFIALVGSVLAASSPAAAAGLFDPATSIEARAAASSRSTEGALRNRLVRLNASELARIVPAGAEKAADRLERVKNLDGVVTLDLFPGISLTARRTNIETPNDGGYVWTGQATGPQPAWVTLVINDNEILGHVQMGGRLYSIEPVSGAVHRVIEINQDKIRDDMHITPPAGLMQKKGDAAEPAPDTATAAGVTTINVMVAHTANARAEVGTPAQMQARINLAVSLTNTAFTNSGVLIKFVRVGGANEINYNDVGLYGAGTSNNYTGVLCDLTGFDCSGFSVANTHIASFNALRTKRNTVKADLVVLMRKQGVACGVAWVPDPPTAATSGQGYAVVTSTIGGVYNCIEGNTLAHETGHNQGLHHDRIQHKAETGVTPPASKFNFGHVDKTGKFFTIMSYRTSCGSGCTRVPYFSTPLKKYPNPTTGRPLGVAQGVAGLSGAANATKTLNTTRTVVGVYR
jgi:hypothetical protein